MKISKERFITSNILMIQQYAMKYHSKKTAKDYAIEDSCQEDMDNIEAYFTLLLEDLYMLENGENND